MTLNSITGFGSILRTTLVASAVTLATLPAAFAAEHTPGLQKFLAEPTSFTAIANGASGPVTFASISGNTLAVQFSIPTHSGNAFGEIVGKVNDDGVMVGNGVLIRDDGQGRATPLTLTFQDDGVVVADVRGDTTSSGFMPNDMFHGY